MNFFKSLHFFRPNFFLIRKVKFNFELDVFNFQPVSGHSVHLVRDAKVFFSRSEFNHHHYSSPENFVSTNFFLSLRQKNWALDVAGKLPMTL